LCPGSARFSSEKTIGNRLIGNERGVPPKLLQTVSPQASACGFSEIRTLKCGYGSLPAFLNFAVRRMA
jgi:hypothetical protein